MGLKFEDEDHGVALGLAEREPILYLGHVEVRLNVDISESKSGPVEMAANNASLMFMMPKLYRVRYLTEPPLFVRYQLCPQRRGPKRQSRAFVLSISPSIFMSECSSTV